MFAALLGSAVIAAFVSKMTVENTNKLKYITGERQKWRNDIRKGMIGLRRLTTNSSDIFLSFAEAKSFFALRLNPNKNFDLKILKQLENLNKNSDLDQTLSCIENNLQNLLKNDWEKSKWEASPKLVHKLFSLIIFFIMLLCNYILFLKILILGDHFYFITFLDLVVKIMVIICINSIIIILLKIQIDLKKEKGYEGKKSKWCEKLLSYLGIFKTLEFQELKNSLSSDIGEEK